MAEAFAEANEHYHAGRLVEAEGILRLLIQAAPQHVEAARLLAAIMAQGVNEPEPADSRTRAVELLRLGVELHGVGGLDGALEFYAGATALDHDNVHALSNAGAALKDLGRLSEAAAMIKKAIAVKPDFAEAHGNLGAVLSDMGDYAAAVVHLEQALHLKPHCPTTCNNLGFARHELGQVVAAIDDYRRALELKPDYADAHYNLGIALHESGDLDSAAASFRKAIAHAPDYGAAHLNLGNVEKERGAADSALACYRQAVAVEPGLALAWNNIGSILKERGDHGAALTALRRAVGVKEDFAEAHFNLGNLLHAMDDSDAAIAAYEKAIAVKPDYAEAHSNLGNLLQELERYDAALASCRRALSINPDLAAANFAMGNILQKLSDSDAALACYKKALAARPSLELELRIALAQPIIMPPVARIMEFRKRLRDEIVRLQEVGGADEEDYRRMGVLNFLSAYHGLNDRKIQESLAALYLKSHPFLNWSAPGVGEPKPTGGRIRVGILSSNLFSHTIGRLNLGIIENIDKKRFEIVILRPPGIEDDYSRRIDAAADRVVVIEKNLRLAREAVAAENLDVLYYPDIGMCLFTYFMAFFRLAPVQCTTWGHPVTTGIPNMDYFLSSTLLEPPQAQEHYSERLHLMQRLPGYYFKTPMPDHIPDREDLGLPPTGNIYLCPQTMFKLHPDFDRVVVEILQRDPEAWMVFIAGNHRRWGELLVERIAGRSAENMGRVLILPRMAGERFIALLTHAAVVLDPLHFCGGRSTSEALSVAAPVVTLPGAFMRGRISAACYRLMGMDDLVARDGDDYIELALRLANDRAWRQAVVEKIAANSHKIFEDREAVREFEKFFTMAARRY